MNFVAHVLVAERVVAPGHLGVWLGAAGPDLARMAGVALAPSTAEVAAGVALHHRTDAVFHDLAWFRDTSRSLTADLGERGVRRGPARGAAHVLVELLLDGALLAGGHDRGAFATTWTALGVPTDEVVALVGPDADPPWRAFLEAVTTRLAPIRYEEPAYAAARVAGTLARRPRLALSPAEEAALLAVAATRAGEVQADAAEVLAAVSRVVQASSDPP